MNRLSRVARVSVVVLSLLAILDFFDTTQARVTGTGPQTVLVDVTPDVPIAQAFPIASEPLESITVQFAAIWPVAVDVRWRLQLGSGDAPQNWTTLVERRSTLWVPAGRSSRRFDFDRVAANRRYRFELVSTAIRPIVSKARPRLTVLAVAGEFPTPDRVFLGAAQKAGLQLVLDTTHPAGSYANVRQRFATPQPQFLRNAAVAIVLIGAALAVGLTLAALGWRAVLFVFGLALGLTLCGNGTILAVLPVVGCVACYRLWRRSQAVSPATPGTVAQTASRIHLRSALVGLSLCLAGAAIFSATFHRKLAPVPAQGYEVRDDGVITLSHARNLVDFGFIGVSPSGERLEAFSAPLQFWTNVVAYGATGIDFRTFCRMQTASGTFLLGGLFAGLLVFGRRPASMTVWFALFVVAAAWACARVLADSRVFLLWHASGMENVYTHVSIAALMLALSLMFERRRIEYWFVPIAFAASISRIDSVVTVSVLLTAFVCVWRLHHRTWQAVVFAVASAIPWVGFMLWRRWYFGQWEPNTAIAQGISIGARLTQFRHEPLALLLDSYQWSFDVGNSLQIFGLIFASVLVVFYRSNGRALSRYVLALAGVLGCVIEYVCFGRARLDEARTVTHLAIFSTAAAPWMMAALDDFHARDLLIGLAILATAVGIADRRPPDRDQVGWGVETFEQNADRIEALATQFHIPRPTVAIPDLGAVSWRKQFNIVDIGRLGSVVTARAPDMRWYIAEIVKPDVIEIHGPWACGAGPVLVSPQFIGEYFPVETSPSPWLRQNCTNDPDARSGLWVRRDIMAGSHSKERAFLDAFSSTFDTGFLRRELSACRAGEGIRPCGYVGRTLFRLVPELKRRRQFDEVAALLAADPRLVVDHAFFTSSRDASWWRRVLPLVHAWP